MATISLYYDKKARKVTLNFAHLGNHARRFLPISLEENQWNGKEVVNHPQRKELNIYLASLLSTAQTTLLNFSQTTRVASLSAVELRDAICRKIFNEETEEKKTYLFIDVFNEFMNTRNAKKTRDTYKYTLPHIKRYDKDYETIKLEDITLAWLNGLERNMRSSVPNINSRMHYMRNIRSVMNYALDNDYTDKDPFRKFKFKSTPTKKRNLAVETLNAIFNFKGTPTQERAADIFKLTFLLIGINFVDLSKLTLDSIQDGRIVYNRSKTSKSYSIKLEPEALELIDKHRGTTHLLSIFDGVSNYENAFIWLSVAFREIEAALGVKHITTYYARHSWSTIAFNDLDIPEEIISMALGHAYGLDTTNIYIDKREKKIDAANRKVIDYVLYGKLPNEGES